MGSRRALQVIGPPACSPGKSSRRALDKALPVLERGKLDWGIRILEHAIRRAPKCPWLWCNLAKALCQKGRRRGSLAALRRARRYPTRSPQLLIEMTREFCCHEQREEELRCAEEAVRLAPRLATTHFNLAATLHESGRDAEALVHARMGVARDPKDGWGQGLLGQILYRKERNEEAIPVLELALALDPRQTDTWFNLGLARLDGDEPEASYRAFLTFCGMRPDDAMGRAFLALAAARSGRRETALHQRRKAGGLEQTAIRPQIRRLYGEIREALAEGA